MATYTKTRFEPAKHGFKFVNSFRNTELIGDVIKGLGLPFPFPDLSFGNPIRTGGRCGGMTYAALDYFLSQKFEVPEDSETPSDGNVLADYLLQRQYDSFHHVGDEYIIQELFSWEKQNYYNRCLPPKGPDFELYKKYIDSDQLRPLALFPVSGIIGHQVLGIGYTDHKDPEEVLIHIYDPNFPDEEMVLKLDSKAGFWKRMHYDAENEVANPVHDHGEFKSWLPLDGYRFKEPNIFDQFTGIRNFTGRNLTKWNPPSKQDLTQYRFTNANFIGNSALESCDFEGVNADGAFFVKANVSRSSFKRASLVKANFQSADLRNTTFNKAVISGTDFHYTELSDAKFREAEGIDIPTYFVRSKCNKTIFDRAKLEANFREASIVESSFRSAQLEDAIFDYIAINTSYFDEADLRSTEWNYAALDRCHFTAANLAYSSWEYASLDRCFFWEKKWHDEQKNEYLKKANLKRAKFTMAVIGRSDFRYANLYKAYFTGADISNTFFTESNLSKSKFINVKFGNVSFYNANLSYASFDGVSFDGGNLTGVNYFGSSWRNANLKNVEGITSSMRTYLTRQGAAL